MPTITLNTTQTTFVSSAQPANNFSGFPLIYAGTDPTYQDCIGYILFAFNSIPVITVDSAVLELSVIIKSGADPGTVAAGRVTEPLNTGTVTYNSQPAYLSTGAQVGVSGADLYKAVRIDVTETVNQWLTGTYPNFGLALFNTTPESLVQFATNIIVYEPYFPRLVLTWSVPPEVPVAGVQRQQQGSPGGIIPSWGALKFNTLLADQTQAITYDTETGVFTLAAPGNYYVPWWVAIVGGDGMHLPAFTIQTSIPSSIAGSAPLRAGQVNGSALITVPAAPVTFTLVNTTGIDLSYANSGVQADIVILKLT